MRKFFESFLGSSNDHAAGDESPDYILKVATAALLLEIAGADDEFTDDERRVIVRTLKDHFGVNDGEIEKILEATRRELDERIDLYHFTSLINEHFDVEHKMRIIEMVWRVIYADKYLNGHEDYLVHRFARLLRLQHDQLIDAKLRVKSEQQPPDK